MLATYDTYESRLIGTSHPNRYAACPFYAPVFNKMKAVVSDLNLPVILAPSPYSKSSGLIFSKRKDRQPDGMKKNSLFRARCEQCSFSFNAASTTIGVDGTIKSILMNKGSDVARHFLAHPTHVLARRVLLLKVFDRACDAVRSLNCISSINDLMCDEDEINWFIRRSFVFYCS